MSAGYELITKLGSGRFSRVYSAETPRGKVALKIYRGGETNKHYYDNEILMLMAAGNHPNVVEHIESIGPARTIVFELAGSSVAELIDYCSMFHNHGIPAHLAGDIFTDTLRGLEHLHSLGIVHTDIKPENLLLNCRVGAGKPPKHIHVRVADLGSSTFPGSRFSDTVGTVPYTAPENIIGIPYSYPMDIWAAFLVYYTLITGDELFALGNTGSDDTGSESTNSTGSTGSTNSTDTGSESTDAGSTSSTSSDSEYREKEAYNHLLQIAEIIGLPSREFALRARTFYNRRGQLKNHPELVPVGLASKIRADCDFNPEICQRIEDYLLLGLTYEPQSRITATEALEIPLPV